MDKEKEELLIVILCILVVIIGYIMVKKMWNNNSNIVEGLENMGSKILAVNSKDFVNAVKIKNEALANELLLNNPDYNENYKDICTEAHDYVKNLMVKKISNLNFSDDTAFIKGINDLNSLQQSIASLNSAFEFIGGVELNAPQTKN